jgi:hypothetical protein
VKAERVASMFNIPGMGATHTFKASASSKTKKVVPIEVKATDVALQEPLSELEPPAPPSVAKLVK